MPLPLSIYLSVCHIWAWLLTRKQKVVEKLKAVENQNHCEVCRTNLCGFSWSRLFMVEPTTSWFTCRRKNVDSKPWHGMSLSVPDDSRSSTTAANDFISSSLTLLISSPTSSSATHSTLMMRDEKRGVGELLQQQQQ